MVIRRQNYDPDCVMAGEYLLALREFALIRGIGAKTLLANTNLDMNTLLNPPRHLLARDVSQVGTNMVQALSEPLVAAIEFGYSMFVGSHGALGVAIQGANTLFEAAEMLHKFMITRSGINEIDIVAENGSTRISVRELSQQGMSRPYDVQLFFNLATLISTNNIAKQLLRDHELKGSIQLNLPMEEPENFPYEKLEGLKVQFDQDECEIVAPLEWGMLPIAQLDEELVSVAQIQCEDDLDLYSPKELSDEIAKLLEVSKGSVPTVEEISAHFHMSPSSLQRRLREKNLTYTKIRTEVLCKKASRLLIETDYSLEDIAAYVGFSDASNFSKAFKTWSGDAPGVYREKHLS